MIQSVTQIAITSGHRIILLISPDEGRQPVQDRRHLVGFQRLSKN
jgi:hypothetical protein